MIVPSDPDYQNTKDIKLGRRTTHPQMGCVADGIEEHFGVRPLDLHYAFVPEVKRFRLTVVLEHEHDRARFTIDHWKIMPDREQVIWEVFHRCLPERAHDRAFLVINAFDRIARAECTERIPKERMDQLKSELAAHGIWEISRFGSATTFFFQTDAQLEASARTGLRDLIKRSYYPLEKAHDEFGYLTAETQNVAFDSRENFEKNFQGNWYYYYK